MNEGNQGESDPVIGAGPTGVQEAQEDAAFSEGMALGDWILRERALALKNPANRIRDSLGLPIGWSREHIGEAVPERRLDKQHAAADGTPERHRQYQRRYSHILSGRVADKNLAEMANRKEI